MNRDPRLDPNADPACRDVDPEIFFPDSGRVDIAATAKATCNRCPIEEKCLDWAIDTKQSAGILGGKTLKERNALKRQRARAVVQDEHRTLLGDLLRERAGDPQALIKEMVHPPMLIAGWAE